LVIASYVIISIKAYIFVALIPGATIWILYDRIKNIQSAFFRILIAPVIIGIGILGSSFILSSLGSSLGSYGSIDKAIDKAIVTKNDLTRDAYGQNSFDIGEMDGSIGSIISKCPVALTAGLFRPFLWDVRNPVMLISAIENTILLLLTFRVFFRLGPFRFFRTIFSEPLLIFSFIFVIFFSFSVGLSTANFGALVRYKIPSLPFFMCLLMILDEVKVREIIERKRLRQEAEEQERAELAKLTL
jgi:hypothetical protein